MYCETIQKSKTVRTRKRIRESEQKVNNGKPNILNPEDFLQEDFKKVQKLLKQATKEGAIRRYNDPLFEKSSSTEADKEYNNKNVKQKDDESIIYSESNPSISLSSSSKSSISESKSSVSDKKQNSKAKVQVKKSKVIGSNEVSRKTDMNLRKREMKDKLKITNGLKDFMNLINKFNSPEAPQLLLKDFTKEESKGEEN
jgi:hypothetical protein